MFKITLGDIPRAIAVAIGTGAVLSVISIVSVPDFDVFSADWIFIGKVLVNGAFSGGVAYIVKQLMTADNGKMFGKI